MPQAIGVFFAYVGQYIVTGLLAVGFSLPTAMFILNTAIQLAALSFLSSVYRKLQGVPDFSSTIKSMQITVRGTLEHQRIVYGETLLSGPIAYVNAANTNNQSLFHAIIVAGHEVESIGNIHLDGNIIPEGYINYGSDGAVNSGDFRGTVPGSYSLYVFRYLGSSNQDASTPLTDAFAEITTAHKGRGLAYFVVRQDMIESQAQVWSSGSPSNYKTIVKGKKVYDPRSDGTQSFGTGPHRLTSSLTWEYNNNPALCWADYMIDQSLGFGEDYSRIDYGYVASAANICDGVIYTPVGTDVRFSCNGALSTGDTYEDNLNKILSSFNGSMVLTGGTWRIRAWSYETPTLSFNEDHARADIQIKLNPNEQNRYNTVRGYFVDKDRLYAPQQFPSVTAAEYVSRDGSVLHHDIQLHMTNDTFMAQRLAAGILEQSDLEKVVVFPANYKVLPAEIGGTIMLSSEKMSWVDKPFRVDMYRLSDMAGIDLVLREDSPDAYTDVFSNEYTISSKGYYAIPNVGVPPPSSLTAEPRLEGVYLKATPPAARLYEYMKFYVAPTNSQFQAAQIARIRGDSYLYPVKTSTSQYFWAKSQNYAGADSVFFPNSDSTDVIANVNTAIFFTNSERSTRAFIASDYTQTPDLVGVRVHPGPSGATIDLTFLANFYKEVNSLSGAVDLTFWREVGAPSGSPVEIAQMFSASVESLNGYGGNYTAKLSYTMTVNTTHDFWIEGRSNNPFHNQWFATSYCVLTAKVIP